MVPINNSREITSKKSSTRGICYVIGIIVVAVCIIIA